jgi:hypothetical protein
MLAFRRLDEPARIVGDPFRLAVKQEDEESEHAA